MLAQTIAAFALSAALQTTAGSGDITLRVSGSGDWTVTCEFQTEAGVRTKRARGRGLNDFDQIAAADAISGACDYTGEDGAFVTVRVQAADGFACPFDAGADIDDCQARFGAGEARFSFERP